jgi:transposase
MRYIGVDLHKKTFTVSYRELDGTDPKTKTFRTNTEGLRKFLKTITKEDKVAVETLGNTYHFVDQIKEHVLEVQIVNTRKFKVVTKSSKKTDKNDANLLSLYLQKDMLPTVRYQDKQSRDLKSIIATRDRLVKKRSSFKNKLHSILLSNGIETKKEQFSSKKGIDNILTSYKLSQSNKLEVEILIEEIELQNRHIERLTKEIEAWSNKLEGSKNLQTITGFAKLSTVILLNGIGPIKDFKGAKSLSSYFGIVPYVSDSAETVRHGHITKLGNSILRTTLIQSTFTAIKYNHYLRNYYDKKKAAKGSGKAIVATSRKMLGIIYETLNNKWIFKDFNNFVLE